MTHPNTYEHIALTAINQYAVMAPEIRFLGKSGNVTFYVETQASNFLLRIYQALPGLQDDIWQKPDVIESELKWLEALRHETNIIVQEPLQNLEGRLVTQVLGDDTQEIFNCSLRELD